MTSENPPNGRNPQHLYGRAHDPSEDRAAVAGLARDLEALHRQVDDLAKLREKVTALAEVVTTLADTVAATPTGNPSPPPAPSWLAFPSDTDGTATATTAARELLTALAEWVRDVYLRYDDATGKFPTCWLWHPDVLEELLWLRAAWQGAYAPGAPRTAVGDWHDRQRPMVVRRIRDYAGVCSLEAHGPGRGQHRAAPGIPHPEAIGPIADWWTTDRSRPGPTPTPEQVSQHNGYWRG